MSQLFMTGDRVTDARPRKDFKFQETDCGHVVGLTASGLVHVKFYGEGNGTLVIYRPDELRLYERAGPTDWVMQVGFWAARLAKHLFPSWRKRLAEGFKTGWDR